MACMDAGTCTPIPEQPTLGKLFAGSGLRRQYVHFTGDRIPLLQNVHSSRGTAFALSTCPQAEVHVMEESQKDI